MCHVGEYMRSAAARYHHNHAQKETATIAFGGKVSVSGCLLPSDESDEISRADKGRERWSNEFTQLWKNTLIKRTTTDKVGSDEEHDLRIVIIIGTRSTLLLSSLSFSLTLFSARKCSHDVKRERNWIDEHKTKGRTNRRGVWNARKAKRQRAKPCEKNRKERVVMSNGSMTESQERERVMLALPPSLTPEWLTLSVLSSAWNVIPSNTLTWTKAFTPPTNSTARVGDSCWAWCKACCSSTDR